MYKQEANQVVWEKAPGWESVYKKTRPVGVSVLAVLNMLGAVLMMVGALGLGLSAHEWGAALLLGLLGFGQLWVARGLWRLQNWARLTALICYGLSSLAGLVALLAGEPAGLIQLLVAGGLAGYLTRVREAFAG